jgi:hypothetical protein
VGRWLAKNNTGKGLKWINGALGQGYADWGIGLLEVAIK